MISYAQNFEDVMLERAFKEQKTGFYIDVGAWDPNEDSITRHFYDKGWHGINIEPVVELYQKFLSVRTRDLNLQLAVGAESGTVVFYDCSPLGNSTCDPEVAALLVFQGKIFKKYDVKQKPLTEICDEYSVGEIDFLKIDVEGFEGRVLSGLDLHRYRPKVILLEATIPNSSTVNYQHWEPSLLSAGYIFVYFDGLNRFYVREESAHLARHFSVPPNVFDEFTLGTLESAKESAVARLEQIHELTRLLKESEADRVAKFAQINTLTEQLKGRSPSRPGSGKNKRPHIIVDLTPLLPGAENGGAKLMTLTLVQRLAQMAPDLRFVLLTHQRTLDEVRPLEWGNAECVVIDGPEMGRPSRLIRWGRALYRRLPPTIRPQSLATTLAHRLGLQRSREAANKLGGGLAFLPLYNALFR